MSFGITSASDVFQRSNEELFAGYPCAIIVDDLLVWGEETPEHDGNYGKVLQRAREVGLKLCPKKCKFRCSQVLYFEHLYTKTDLKPYDAKFTAIKGIPVPDFPGHFADSFVGQLSIPILKQKSRREDCYPTGTATKRHTLELGSTSPENLLIS